MAISYVVSKLPKIGVIQVDSNLSEDVSFTNVIPDHPLESGYSISDTIIHNPTTVTLNCIVANDSLYNQTLIDDKSSTRPDNAYIALKKLVESDSLVTVITSMQHFSSMGVESVSIPRESGDGTVLKFTATFKKVKVESSKYVIDENNAEASSLGNTNEPSKAFNEIFTSDESAEFLTLHNPARSSTAVEIPKF